MLNQAQQIELAISETLTYCDLVSMLGNRKQRAHAKKQRSLAFAALKLLNDESGMSKISDDELLAGIYG